MSLIQIQEAAITMLEQERSSDKRYQRYVNRVVFPWFAAQLRGLGFNALAIRMCWQDAVDMHVLRANAED